MNSRGIAIASLVASMFSGCGIEDTKVDTVKQAIVKCAGINSCAGQGACASKSPDGGMNDCAGKNSCAGQGWVEVPRSECDAKNGTTL